MKNKIAALDIFGENKGKWSVFNIGSVNDKEKQNRISSKIRSFYNDLGVDVKHIMTEDKDGSYSLIFENGGISQLYLDRFAERLRNEFKLSESYVKIKKHRL